MNFFPYLLQINMTNIFCLSYMKALSYASDYCFPTFHNLSQLELIVDAWSGWTLLPYILGSSPNLESLVFPQVSY